MKSTTAASSSTGWDNSYNRILLGVLLAGVPLITLHGGDVEQRVDSGRMHFDGEIRLGHLPAPDAVTDVARAAYRRLAQLEANTN